jgi:hypothetical protein
VDAENCGANSSASKNETPLGVEGGRGAEVAREQKRAGEADIFELM